MATVVGVRVTDHFLADPDPHDIVNIDPRVVRHRRFGLAAVEQDLDQRIATIRLAQCIERVDRGIDRERVEFLVLVIDQIEPVARIGAPIIILGPTGQPGLARHLLDPQDPHVAAPVAHIGRDFRARGFDLDRLERRHIDLDDAKSRLGTRKIGVSAFADFRTIDPRHEDRIVVTRQPVDDAAIELAITPFARRRALAKFLDILAADVDRDHPRRRDQAVARFDHRAEATRQATVRRKPAPAERFGVAVRSQDRVGRPGTDVNKIDDRRPPRTRAYEHCLAAIGGQIHVRHALADSERQSVGIDRRCWLRPRGTGQRDHRCADDETSSLEHNAPHTRHRRTWHKTRRRQAPLGAGRGGC